MAELVIIIQDRSNTIRIRPLKESRYFPAVDCGADDLFTEKATQYWGGLLWCIN